MICNFPYFPLFPYFLTFFNSFFLRVVRARTTPAIAPAFR